MPRRFLTPVELPGDAAAPLHAVPRQQLDGAIAGRAAAAHTHAAGDITGVLAAARLPLVPNPPLTQAYAASLTPDASLGNYRICTLTGNCTLNPPGNATDGQLWRIRFIAATATRTLTLAAVAALHPVVGLRTSADIPAGIRADVGMLWEAADSAWTVLAFTVQT